MISTAREIARPRVFRSLPLALRLPLVLCLAALALLTSCAKDEMQSPPELYWPLPPEKPRIKFLDVIIGSKDAELRFRKIKEYLFGEPAETKFVKPFGVCARKNVMYVTDVGGFHVFDFETGDYRMLGGSQVTLPTDIDVDDAGNIYVGDIRRKSVSVFNQKGEPVREIGNNLINVPGGIAVDNAGKRLIVSDGREHKVYVFTLEGEKLFEIGRKGVDQGEFNIPYGVAVDRTGRIYVVDFGNFRIQIFAPDGTFIKTFGTVGLSPGTFARPKSIAIDSDEHIYVLDAAFANFQIFDFEGNILLAVGRPGNGLGEFLLPSSLYIDEKDEIYVVDQINKRVQIFQYLKEN